jgi:isoquinoline 1-oxidoreductase alpha subunit
MIMSAVALLKSTPHPDRPQIVRAMNGNVCRCGAYARIVSAIELVAAQAPETSASGSGR